MSLASLIAEGQGRHDLFGRIDGVVTAVVTAVDDPDGLGRVKVRYPWLEEDAESPWARVASPMAGPGVGWVSRPSVAQEVVVAFVHGDMRFPIVVASLWNGSDAMPGERGSDGDNAVRLIKTPAGHKIVLDDSSGGEKITIEDANGNVVELSSSGVVVKAREIRLGSDGAAQGLVLGDAFLTLFNAHTHPTGVGPSGPPASPMVKGSHVSASHKTE